MRQWKDKDDQGWKEEEEKKEKKKIKKKKKRRRQQIGWVNQHSKVGPFW